MKLEITGDQGRLRESADDNFVGIKFVIERIDGDARVKLFAATNEHRDMLTVKGEDFLGAGTIKSLHSPDCEIDFGAFSIYNDPEIGRAGPSEQALRENPKFGRELLSQLKETLLSQL